MSQDENWLDFDPLLKLPNGEKSSHGITNISTKELVYDKHVILGGISLGFITWNTIERITIADLIIWATTTITTTLPAEPNKYDPSNKTTTWETMQCRLVEARYGCAAATVHDRYIVVVGGRQKSGGLVSSVEILDTVHGRVLQGPPLTVRRHQLGLAVVGSRLYAVGGRRSLAPTDDSLLQSIEYWDFDDSAFGFQKGNNKDNTHLQETPSTTTTKANESSFSDSWRIHPKLALTQPRYNHAVVKVGSCLLVSEGCQDWRVWESRSVNATRYGLDPV